VGGEAQVSWTTIVLLTLFWPSPFIAAYLLFVCSINYEIKADRIIIKVRRFNWMNIPYSEVEKIEPSQWIDSRDFRILQRSNPKYFNKRYKLLAKSRGACRFIRVNPKNPRALLDAFAAYRARNPSSPLVKMAVEQHETERCPPLTLSQRLFRS
jgi:hypothetical protein